MSASSITTQDCHGNRKKTLRMFEESSTYCNRPGRAIRRPAGRRRKISHRNPEFLWFDSDMLRSLRFLAVCLLILWAAAPTAAQASHLASSASRPETPQESGFLNRKIDWHGTAYRFQVYLPEEWRRDDRRQWPVILFLHGRGERGS